VGDGNGKGKGKGREREGKGERTGKLIQSCIEQPSVSCSEFGTLHMEFAYLSDITGNPIYKEKVETIREFVQQAEK
jgi:hypothetical protein